MEELHPDLQELHELKGRLARVERSARRAWMVGIVALGAGLAIGGAIPGQSDSDAGARGVRFKAPFSITDKKGKVIFRVTADRDGGGHLDLFDGGVALFHAGHEGNERGVTIRDKKGKKVVDIGVDADDEQGRGVDVHDAEGNKVVDIGVGDEGRGIDVHDEAGVKVIDLGIGDEGRGLDIHNANGDPVAIIHADEASGAIHLNDNSGNEVFHAPF
jgi:hypothetical protein